MVVRHFSTAVFAASLFCLLLSAALAAPPTGVGGAQQEQVEKYKIYCAEGVIDISTLNEEQLREERKAEVCRMIPDEFDNMYQARTAAKRFGGVGAACGCAR